MSVFVFVRILCHPASLIMRKCLKYSMRMSRAKYPTAKNKNSNNNHNPGSLTNWYLNALRDEIDGLDKPSLQNLSTHTHITPLPHISLYIQPSHTQHQKNMYASLAPNPNISSKAICIERDREINIYIYIYTSGWPVHIDDSTCVCLRLYFPTTSVNICMLFMSRLFMSLLKAGCS